jgi:multiple sugar transport system permease protein
MGASLQAAKRRRERLRQGAVLVVLCLGGVSMVLPLVWMLSTSLKDPGSIYTYPPEFVPRKQVTVQDAQSGQATPVYSAQVGGKAVEVVLLRTVKGANIVRVLSTRQELQIPLEGPGAQQLKPVRHVHVQWSNYPEAWRALKLDTNWMSFDVPAYRFRVFGATFQTKPWHSDGIRIQSAFLAFYLNSILVAGLATLGQVFTSSLAAFAFARLRFRGRDTLFLGYLGTLMVPFVVTMIPVFALFNVIRLYDTYAALILPAMFSAYGTFMLRQFFVTIPHELEDAARIDGCGHWGVYRHVVLPLSKPALATLTTFTFLYSWNNFMWPLIMIDSDQRKPLMLGLHTFMGRYSTDWTLLMAASVMVMVPVLLVFIFGQRYFVKGIQMTGLKG